MGSAQAGSGTASTRPATTPSALEDELKAAGLTGDQQQAYMRRQPEVEAIKKLGVTDHKVINSQLETANEGTFTSRQRQPGEKFYARRGKGAFNGNWTSPMPTEREEAIQGHALAWTGSNFDEKLPGPGNGFKQHDIGSQHSEAQAFKYAGDAKDARWIAESIAAPQTHRGTGDLLSGGLPQQWQAERYSPSLKRDTSSTGTGAVVRDAAGTPELVDHKQHDAMPMAPYVKMLGTVGRARERLSAKKKPPP